MTKVTDYMEAIWSLPFMLSIVQKLLIKLCLKTTPKISTKAATLHVSRENRGGENTRKARFRQAQEAVSNPMPTCTLGRVLPLCPISVLDANNFPHLSKQAVCQQDIWAAADGLSRIISAKKQGSEERVG